MLNKVNNSQPAFGMSMYKIPEKYQREFAQVIGIDNRLAKKGLDRYIKRAAKNPHFDVLYKPGEFVESKATQPAAMFVINNKGNDKITSYENTGKSYLQYLLDNYKKDSENAGVLKRFINSISAGKAKIEAKFFKQENMMPEFMVKALRAAERYGAKEQRILDMTAEAGKILDKNSDIMLKS